MANNNSLELTLYGPWWGCGDWLFHSDDFSPEQEKKLCAKYPDATVFTHSWPSEAKPFYIMTMPQRLPPPTQAWMSLAL